MKKSWKILVACMLVTVFAMQLVNVIDAAPRKKKKEIAPSKFARVAILPVINLEEDIDYANTMVFQEALDIFRYPDYEIYDNDKVYKALEDVNYYEVAKDGAVTEEMLRTIMQKSGAEMVIMVKLNKLTQEYYTHGREDSDQLTLDMEVMAVYNWTDKVSKTHIKDKKVVEYAVVMKRDWKMEAYNSAVKKQLGRIANFGKK